MKNSKIIKAVRLFALAAMFMVLAPSALSAQGTIGPNVPDANGIFLSKKVTSFDYSTLSGMLTLECYVTGDMKMVSEPVDVVLVLDVSESMSSSNKFTKMQESAKNLIAQLKDTGNTRVGIVSFSKGAVMESDFLKLTDSSVSTLNSIIDGLKKGAYTAINLGASIALDMFKSCASPSKKYCIFLTDGQPTDASQPLSDYEIAEQAWQTTWEMKQPDLDIQVYSIYLGSSGYNTWFNDGGYYMTVGNFLDGLSSNFPTAWWNNYDSNSSYSKVQNYWKQKAAKRTDAAAANRASSDYLKKVDNASDLNDVFKGIGNQIISQSAQKLPATTVLKDFFSTSCSLADNITSSDPSGVKTYYAIPVGGNKTDGYILDNRQHLTSAASGDYADIKNVTVTVKGSGNDRHVEVAGFDYSKYCVIKDDKGAYHGCELLVDIPFKFNDISAVTVDTDGHYIFNTNAPVSGLYEKDGSDPMAGPGGSQLTFEVPSVRYVELVVKTSGLKNIAGDPDAGIPASQESAMFKIERKTGESTYEEIGIVSLTGKDASGSAVTSAVMPLDPDGTYRVTPLSGWGWTYSVTPINGSDQPKKASAGANQVVFEYQATKSADIQTGNNEKVKSNKFN